MTDHIEGTFDRPVRCPECGKFMDTGYDDYGLPYVQCRDLGCSIDRFGDSWLRDTGNWSED